MAYGLKACSCHPLSTVHMVYFTVKLSMASYCAFIFNVILNIKVMVMLAVSHHTGDSQRCQIQWASIFYKL